MLSVEKSRKAIYVASIFTHFRVFHIPFLRMLQEEGFEVWAAARTTNEADRKELEAIGIKCVEFPFSRSPYSISNIKAYRMMRKLFRENHFELVHVHTPAAAFIARAAARGTGQGKVIYTAHGFHFYKGAPLKNWLIYYTAEKIARKWTDVLITMNSEDYVNGAKLGYAEGRSLFLTHGVGVDIHTHTFPDVSCPESILTCRDERTSFICIAEMIPRKNHLFLLRGWLKAFDNSKKVVLRLVGSGPIIERIQDFIRSNLLENVEVLGYRNDVPKLLLNSDVVVLVSEHEGLPRCVMEAMATGKPVIGTNIRGTRDLVKHGENGLLVDLGNCEQLANALQMLSKSKDLREAYGNRGKQMIEEFSTEKVVEEMQNIYFAVP